MDTNTQRKKHQRSWVMYDWANSAYNLVITSTIFPAYYTAVTTQRVGDTIISDQVNFFGWQVKNSSLFEYALAFAYLIIAFLSPILSAIADYKGNKKSFMGAFTILGSLACCGLYFFTADTVSWSLVLFCLAAIGYCGALVFYNAFLPEIASLEQRDKLSAKGYAMGYFGSVLLQILCLVFVLNDAWFQDATFAPRLSFLLVGIWWFGFALIPLFRLPNTPPHSRIQKNFLTGGFQELQQTWRIVRKMPLLKSYLAAFFFYSTGVQTVMLAATIFGSKELHLETQQLIITILLIQIVAIIGAFLMAKLSEKIGNLQVLLLTVILWIGVCIAAYFITTAIQFYLLAVVVGFIMGGIQSLSRSTYSKLMPETKDTASFFSFYDVVEKLAIVLGMFSFGYIDQMYSMRQSILALIVFFLVGAVILFLTLSKQKKIRNEIIPS